MATNPSATTKYMKYRSQFSQNHVIVFSVAASARIFARLSTTKRKRIKRDSQKLFCDATRDATRSAMDACDANSRNTIHRRSQLCDKVLQIWLRHHDIRAV